MNHLLWRELSRCQSLRIAREMCLPNHIHDQVEALPSVVPLHYIYIHEVLCIVIHGVSSARRKGKKAFELVPRRCSFSDSMPDIQAASKKEPQDPRGASQASRDGRSLPARADACASRRRTARVAVRGSPRRGRGTTRVCGAPCARGKQCRTRIGVGWRVRVAHRMRGGNLRWEKARCAGSGCGVGPAAGWSEKASCDVRLAGVNTERDAAFSPITVKEGRQATVKSRWRRWGHATTTARRTEPLS